MRPSTLALIPASLALLGTAPTERERLHDLFRREWGFRLRENPLFATGVGAHEHDHRLPAISLADEARRAEAARAFLAEAATIDPARLHGQDRVSHEMFVRQLEDRRADFELGEHFFSFNADSGFHTEFAQLPKTAPLRTVRDYESYLARLEAWPRYVQEHIELLREAIARGMTQPRIVLQGIEVTIASHVVDDPEQSVFYRPFVSFPTTVPAGARDRLRESGRRAVLESVGPGYRRFLEFMNAEYQPRARTTLGASELPNGGAYYAHRVRHFTTLDLSPDEIHRVGLEEVKRIRAEMEAAIRKTGFDGDFAAFLRFLRTDSRFYAKTADELLREASFIAKTMDGRLPALFKTLPRLPYGVAPVPEHLAPKYTSGRYVAAPRGSTQPGWYWVNTYALESRPLYNLEALTLHEAVPGHHLQIALARELEGLPPFRRFSYVDAFGEGWGLYSEWLGLEAGFYADPYRDFGRLGYEMWRACRLVVDTGLHAMGWSREQAIEFLASRTALPLHEVRTETDRYISWPGQALAYKVGELKIKALRRRAEAALGSRFDVREFHDAVLRNGPVPLPVLEREIEGFIDAARRGAASP